MPASRKLLAVTWILRVLVGLAFLIIGTAKLTGTLHTVETFRAFGWGQWFRYLTGMVEAIGAILLFVPRWTCYGALLLTCTIGLGTVLSLIRLHDNPAVPRVLIVLSGALAWLTRPWASELQGSTGIRSRS